MGMRWYIVHVYSGYENTVSRALSERIGRSDIPGMFGRVLVPTEEVVEMKNGQKSITERKLYPGYVLVEMEMCDESWHLVNSTQRVMGFIGGTMMKPAPLSAREVDGIMRQIEEGGQKPRPKVLYEVGQNVRVKDGPFTDFHGMVEDINYEKSRLRVSISIFGRATPVELDFSQVEKG